MTSSTPPPTGRSATTITARSPEDVLALVPVVLGFLPEESVAMLTFGATEPFHARVDLPDPDGGGPIGGVEEVVQQLLGPARQHAVRSVFFVLYTADERLAATTTRALVRAFLLAGVDVVDALRADGSRWYPASGRRAGVPPQGVPYDLMAHPLLAQAVLEGRVLLRSREELRATLGADDVAVARVVAALAEVPGAAPPPDPIWAGAVVDAHVAAGTVADDHELARLLRGMLDPRVRDETWRSLGRDNARAHVDFWSDVVRRTPSLLVAAPAAVLALASWQAGHGALAWCALDRGEDAGASCSLATLVEGVLLEAVPPDAWTRPEPADECEEDRRG